MILAFSGARKSGKSTAFEVIHQMDAKVELLSFAAPLKAACAEVFELPPEYFEHQDLKNKELLEYITLQASEIERFYNLFLINDFDFNTHVRPFIGTLLQTPREMLIFIGTNVLRNYDKDIHVKAALKDLNLNKTYVVTDLRFINEYEALVALNSNCFYIDNRKAEASTQHLNTPSEKERFTFQQDCSIIYNNSTLYDFQNQIINIYKELTYVK
jgi:hypothetical protein